MSNPDPYQARIARKRRGRNGSLATAQRILWRAVLKVEATLEDEKSAEMVIKCTHALSQALQAYGRLVETGQLEDRLKVLEAQLKNEVANAF